MLISSDEEARPSPLMVIEGVTAGYGGAPTIQDVSARVGSGEVVSILGPNGAGKSTLLKALVGILRASSGTVSLGGEDITNLSTDTLARKGLGYVPQVKDVFDTLTVQENLEMGGYLLTSAEIAGRLEKLLDLFPQLKPMLKRTAGKLSGGERKQLAICRVLMLEPRVLILDEPTASLSPGLATVLLRDHVRNLADTGTAVLLVEQKASAALEISNWSYVMVSGRTQLSGSAQELLARPDFGEVFLGQEVAALPETIRPQA